MLSATACTDCNLLLYQNPDLAITFLLSRWDSTFGRGRITLLKVTLTIAGHRRSLVLLTSSRPALWGWKFADMQNPPIVQASGPFWTLHPIFLLI